MKKLKHLLINILLFFILLIFLIFIVTTLNYFEIISLNILNISKIIIPLISIFISGIFLGNKAHKHGFLEGFKISFIIIFIFTIINLILTNSFNMKDFIFYILLFISSVFGSMLGINLKKES